MGRAQPQSWSQAGAFQTNPKGFAGLDNDDIDTADLFHVWMGGSLKTISMTCGSGKERDDIKTRTRFSSRPPALAFGPSITTILKACVVSSLHKHIRYVGPLRPAAIASWLHDEVGLAWNGSWPTVASRAGKKGPVLASEYRFSDAKTGAYLGRATVFGTLIPLVVILVVCDAHPRP